MNYRPARRLLEEANSDIENAIKTMPNYFKKYYKLLKGKVDEEKIISYLAGIDIDNARADLENPDIYDWDTNQGIQATIRDIELFAKFADEYKKSLQHAVNGWKKM